MSNTYQVEILHQGTLHTLTVSEDQTVLNAALEQGVDLPSSCNAGVCTTCAAVIKEGTVEQPDSMGINAELQAKGYVLLCSAYPRSDLRIEADKEEEVYHLQFGQFQQQT
jgi:ferredoxin